MLDKLLVNTLTTFLKSKKGFLKEKLTAKNIDSIEIGIGKPYDIININLTINGEKKTFQIKEDELSKILELLK